MVRAYCPNIYTVGKGETIDSVKEYDFNTNKYTEITKIEGGGLAAHGCTGYVTPVGLKLLFIVGGHVNSVATSKCVELVILASQLTKPFKVKRLFSLSTGSTRGPQRYKFKVGKYKFNPNHNKSNLLVLSFLNKAFKIAIIR